MRRSVNIRRSADSGTLEVRAGDKVLGPVTGLQSESDTLMTGTFTHRPAFADFAGKFLNLSRALEAGRSEEADQIRAELAADGVALWLTSHDMRIDRPSTLVIAEGRVAFAPNDAFLMMRTGGLG